MINKSISLLLQCKSKISINLMHYYGQKYRENSYTQQGKRYEHWESKVKDKLPIWRYNRQ